MRLRTAQTGIGHLAVVIAILAIGVAGFAGYTVWQANQDKPAAKTADANTKIETESDLDATGTLLDTSASQLDQDLDASSLDSDINQLL